MFNLVKGVSVSNLQDIYECYSIDINDKYTSICINVSAENIENLFKRLCSCVRTPGFFVLEVPTNANVEADIRKNNMDSFHNDVYYLDGGSYSDLLNLFDKYKELLINDGFIKFGFGSHKGYDEVFVVDYKIFQIYTDEPEKYFVILNEIGVNENKNYKNVWDNFSKKTPGVVKAYEIEGFSVYDMIDELKKMGLYFAERRAEE